MANLWERMSHLYGHKWTSVYGESAYSSDNLTDVAMTWASGLRGVSGDQIAIGLRRCCDSGEAWPPTLPEFRAMCIDKGQDEYGTGYVPEYYRARTNTVLLEKISDPEVGKKHVSEIKKLLGEKDA